ncbi:hypothetical protein Tco_1470484, partial [Tanacetum coccineum]
LELQKELDKRKEVVGETTQSHDIDWSDPAVLRYHTLQNRPFFVREDSEIEKEVMKRPEFDFQQKQLAKKEKEKKADDRSSKPSGGSRKKTLARKRASEKQSEESAKRQKMEDDTKKEELKAHLDIVPGDEV